MKTLWILLATIGFTLSEKLDLTYLPPPGSKFSGGSPGINDVPLEFPREGLLSGPDNNNVENPEIAIGIDRIGPSIFPENKESGTEQSLQNNEYSFPTTESYSYPDTTPTLPAEKPTRRPDISLNSKYASNNSTNFLSPYYLDEKKDNYEVLDPTSSSTLGPSNFHNAVEEIENNLLNNQFPDSKDYLANKTRSNGSRNSYGGDIDSITENNFYSAKPSIFDDTLFNNYETGSNVFHNPSSLEPNNIQEINYISSTPVYTASSKFTDSEYSKTSSQILPSTEIGIKSSPQFHIKQPERIQAQSDREAVILNYDTKITPDGYAYSFDTSNGIHAEEMGTAINGVRANGSYSYVGDDGKLYSVTYTADENGFRPYGAHLPTSPPIPNAILKVIEQAAKDREAGIYDDGSYDENKYGFKKYDTNKNLRFHNRLNKDKDTKINNKQSNQQPTYTKLSENADIRNEQIATTKNKFTPLTENDSIKEIKENGNFKLNNNDYNSNGLQEKITNFKPNLKDSERGDELYDEYGYHYSGPQYEKSYESDVKLFNRFSESPAHDSIQIMYKEMSDNAPAKPFMTPYVFQNDETLLDYVDEESSVNIPTQDRAQSRVLPSDQISRTDIPTLSKTKADHQNDIKGQVDGTTGILSSDDQGYFYPKKVSHFYNDVNIPFVVSSNSPEDITTTPKAFSSRFNSIESISDDFSSNPSQYTIENQTQFPNRSSDDEKQQPSLINTNNKENFVNNYNEEITEPEFEQNYKAFQKPSLSVADDETLTFGEDFGGPKQVQKYDPLTGYYY